MKAQEAKQLVVKAGIELMESGLIARTWGNISCRIGSDSFAITPSGRDYSSLKPEEIIEVNIEDLSYEGSIKPSSEKGIHKEVYSSFPEINFVIHTHQEYASALSVSGLDEIPVPHEYISDSFSENILCASYALPGTKSLRKNAAACLEKTKSNAIILKHHGALCFGKDYGSAFETSRSLEEICLNFINNKGGDISADKDCESSAPPRINEVTAQIMEEKGGFLILCNNPQIIKCADLSSHLMPYLDDFAQIVGLKAKVCNNDAREIIKGLKHSSAVLIKNVGALCWGQNEKDAQAVCMIVKKNSSAYLTARLFNNLNPINTFESMLMRFIYLKKYSKLY
ncbi:MAG: class II aldolase/adducin family protein [Tissierellia bacterium]|jgi:L-fuculose-phosphate aldolase|nr:class II aldolase/adducin family protein [Tissierellia bacterium]